MECVLLVAVCALAVFLIDEAPTWMKQRHKQRMAELRIRRLEALARMSEPDRERLLATMPDWLDRDDADDVEAWKKARREVIRTKE